MEIKTTQTWSISEENKQFVDAIIQKYGGYIGDETKEQAIHRILGAKYQSIARNIAVEFLNEYFGIVGKQNAEALISLIDNGALTTVTTIE